ncbi:MAG: 2-hydroxyacid dehydrogenase [Patescibacteria group bacterium]
MALIYVTRQIPTVGLEALEAAGHEVVVSEKDGVLTPGELQAALTERPYEGLVSLLTDTIDASVLAAAPQLRIVANYAVGYNNIDVADLAAQGVTVTNTPGVLTDTVAEFTVALMLALAKRIPEADRFTRAGHYTGWAPELLLGSDLVGKTLGIVGAGRIGSGVARRAQHGFGMHVQYHDLNPSSELDAANCTYCESLDTLLREADVVSLHVPLLPATTHLINAERLALMKPSAYLINTSRGPVIDEAALVEALGNGTIRGAALDVFAAEPALSPGLAELDNVILTPHIASASQETRSRMSELVAENLISFFAGGSPPHVVPTS